MSGGKDTGEKRREEADKPAGPGFIGRLELRVIDAALAWLQHLRERVAPGAGGAERRGSGKEAAGAVAAAAEGSAGAASTGRHRLRWFLIGLLLVVIAGAAGVGWAWRHFETRLGKHDEIVDRLQEELQAAAKEEKRASALVDRFQRENGELRLQSREARAEAETLRERVEGLTRQVDEAKRVAQQSARAQTAAATAAAPRQPTSARSSTAGPPPKTGRCAVGSGGSAEQIVDCIDKFNQR